MLMAGRCEDHDRSQKIQLSILLGHVRIPLGNENVAQVRQR